MIYTETVTIKDKKYKRTYSDAGYLLLQVETGKQYQEAIDTENSVYTYEETDVLSVGASQYEIIKEENT